MTGVQTCALPILPTLINHLGLKLVNSINRGLNFPTSGIKVGTLGLD